MWTPTARLAPLYMGTDDCIDTQTAIYLNAVNVAGASADDLRRKHPFGGPGTPGDIARFAVTLASEDASWMTGACVPIDGGYTAH